MYLFGMMGPGVFMDTVLNHKQFNFAIGKFPHSLFAACHLLII